MISYHHEIPPGPQYKYTGTVTGLRHVVGLYGSHHISQYLDGDAIRRCIKRIIRHTYQGSTARKNPTWAGALPATGRRPVAGAPLKIAFWPFSKGVSPPSKKSAEVGNPLRSARYHLLGWGPAIAIVTRHMPTVS